MHVMPTAIWAGRIFFIFMKKKQMKKYSLFILTLLITVAFISCNKQKKSLESTSIENTKSENIQTEINSQEIRKKIKSISLIMMV